MIQAVHPNINLIVGYIVHSERDDKVLYLAFELLGNLLGIG